MSGQSQSTRSLKRHARILVEELAAVAPAEMVATCDAVGIGDILQDLRHDPDWSQALHALAHATRRYVHMRRSAARALVVRRIRDHSECPRRRAMLTGILADAEQELVDRHRTWAGALEALVHMRQNSHTQLRRVR